MQFLYYQLYLNQTAIATIANGNTFTPDKITLKLQNNTNTYLDLDATIPQAMLQAGNGIRTGAVTLNTSTTELSHSSLAHSTNIRIQPTITNFIYDSISRHEMIYSKFKTPEIELYNGNLGNFTIDNYVAYVGSIAIAAGASYNFTYTYASPYTAVPMFIIAKPWYGPASGTSYVLTCNTQSSSATAVDVYINNFSLSDYNTALTKYIRVDLLVFGTRTP